MIEDEVAGSSGRMLQLHPSARLRHEEGSSKSRATLERAALTSANGSRRIIACHELPQKSRCVKDVSFIDFTLRRLTSDPPSAWKCHDGYSGHGARAAGDCMPCAPQIARM
jgi:hypothetical protein